MENEIYDLLILGGGCAGLSAGIYAGRAKLKTAIIEKQAPGGQASITDEIANYPGFNKISGYDLAERMLNQCKSFGTKWLIDDIERVEFNGEVKKLISKNKEYRSYAVIIAAGATAKKLDFKGAEKFQGRGIGYCATCDGFFFEGKDIFVIGGGYSAAEEALYLTRFAKKVTVIVRKNSFKCAKVISDRVLSHPKIEVLFNTEITEAFGDKVIKGAKFKNKETNVEWEYNVSEKDNTFGIFIFIGYKPNTKLFENVISLDDAGYILTDDNMKTEISGVFAAGDIRQKTLRQLVTAVSDGAIAATEAEKYISDYKENHSIQSNSIADNKADKPVNGDNNIISSEVRSQVVELFNNLKKDVHLYVFTMEDDEKSTELEDLCTQVSAFSERLHLKVFKKGESGTLEKTAEITNIPSLILMNCNEEYSGIKFSGIPIGHEFNSLISAIYNLGGSGKPLSNEANHKLNKLHKDTKLQIAIAPKCNNCPKTVTSAQRLAVFSSHISAEMVDIEMFSELKENYNITNVPALIINGKSPVFGVMSEEEILDLLEEEI